MQQKEKRIKGQTIDFRNNLYFKGKVTTLKNALERESQERV